MTKLNQIIAVEKGVKATSQSELTKQYQLLQKTGLLAGLSRTYTPKDEEGEELPPEQTRVQVQADAVLRRVAEVMTRYFDVTATKEWANVQAKADVVVDGRTLLRDVPVTYLLFLEKRLTDIHTLIEHLPLLDAADPWQYDPSTDAYRTEPTKTVRTKKVPRNHVKAEATEHHPAQVEMYYEDIPVGTWTTVKFSGALPAARVNELRDRVEKLQAAVLQAREEANEIEVTDQKIGDAVFGYLFAK
jgi:hypothetical protein